MDTGGDPASALGAALSVAGQTTVGDGKFRGRGRVAWTVSYDGGTHCGHCGSPVIPRRRRQALVAKVEQQCGADGGAAAPALAGDHSPTERDSPMAGTNSPDHMATEQKRKRRRLQQTNLESVAEPAGSMVSHASTAPAAPRFGDASVQRTLSQSMAEPVRIEITIRTHRSPRMAR